LASIDQFYDASTLQNSRFDEINEQASSDSRPVVDRALQEDIWALLTKHPNVSVGRDRSFNGLPLSDIESTYASAHECVTVSAYKETESTGPIRDDRAVAPVVSETRAVSEDAVAGSGTNAKVSDQTLDRVAADSSEHDGFGLPRRHQQVLQNRYGQTSLTDALNSAKASNFKPSAADLVASEKTHGEDLLDVSSPQVPQENYDDCGVCGDPGELLCCDGCPNVFHGACLDPPIDTNNLPDDQWYCPRCEMSGAQNKGSENSFKSYSNIASNVSSSISKAAITEPGPAVKRKMRTKPVGRPRKFLAGTELFWRGQLSKAPASFASRPPDFDATLLRALNSGLPTPEGPADITQHWVDMTLAVLDRKAHGLCISPKGILHRGSEKRKAVSQVVILRSARLAEVDFSDSHEVSAVRFLSSSAAHTFASLRFYPRAEPSEWPSLFRSLEVLPAASLQTPVHSKGPKLGIFYDNTHQHSLQRSSFAPAVPKSRRQSGQSVSTTGPPIVADDVDPRSLVTTPQPTLTSSLGTIRSQNNSSLDASRGPSAPRRLNGLPPPLTTRAASKRQASAQNMLVTGSAGNLQNVPMSVLPSAKPDSHNRDLSDFDDYRTRYKKRAKRKTTGSSLRQQIVLDLIERCGGAVPENSLLLWKAVTAALQRSGEAGVPDRKTIETMLKALCTAGKIKKSTFSFKDQRGFMVISSTLAKPELGPSDPVIRQLQKKIIEAYPNRYAPSGMYVDQTNQVEDDHRPPPGVQLQRLEENFQSPVETTQFSSALQPIENDALRPSENAERTPGAKQIAGLEASASLGRRRGRPVLGENPISNSNPAALSSGVSEDVNFLMRQERPIIFDVTVPLELPESTTEAAKKESKKVVWQKGRRRRPLPHSLEEILKDGTRRSRSSCHSAKLDPSWSQFESEVDCVARWEERSFNRFQQKNESQSWSFISHFVGQEFEAVCTENTPLEFHGLTRYDKSGQEKLVTSALLRDLWSAVPDNQQRPAASRKSPLMAQSLEAYGMTRSQTIRDSDTTPRANHSRSMPSKKRKRKTLKSKPSKKKKQTKDETRKKRKTEVEPAYITNPDGTVIDVSGYINAPTRRPRGAQHLRNMSEAEIYRLTVAIVVIRTLSGGLDKHIDWTIVMRIFPEEDPDFVRDRWRTIRNKFRRDIAALTENLQDRFCSAYIEGKVPDLDFDDVYNNDWEGIVEWAVRTLDRSCVREIDDLPGSREELAEMKVMAFEEHRGMREYLGYNVGSSLPVREAAQASIVFARPVESAPLQPLAFTSDAIGKEGEELNVAKSWALATMLTQEGSYDAHACKKKLSKLANTSRASNALFDKALKSLASEKAVVRDKEATTGVASRGYTASKLFYDAFDGKRTVQATLLRQAARYKRDILDLAFSAGQQTAFQPLFVNDGDMVAILNLLAHGKVRAQIGPDVPKNRYGLLTADGLGTYQTRHLEKDKLSFTVILEAVKGVYVYGNPIEMQVAPVPAIAEYENTAIPVWVDIHGNFQDELWELVICAVIGLVSTRPGIDAKELVKTLSPSLTLWETETVLLWMERSGLVQVSGKGRGQGWETTEWWWLICGKMDSWHLGSLS
jgi:hypothetical protein